MAEFSSTNSYQQFEWAVKRKTRYIYDTKVRNFLETVMETSKTRKGSFEMGVVLWRAQRGYIWRTEFAGTEYEFEVPGQFGPERMVPKPELVRDGRVNPAGIAYL